VKRVLLAVAVAGLLAVFSGRAQASEPYYYDPYTLEAPVPPAPYYDPYYQLHVIHYQLYLRSYPTVVYPYYVRRVPVVVAAPPVVVLPAGVLKAATPVRSRVR
jgi:hypothetical protein